MGLGFHTVRFGVASAQAGADLKGVLSSTSGPGFLIYAAKLPCLQGLGSAQGPTAVCAGNLRESGRSRQHTQFVVHSFHTHLHPLTSSGLNFLIWEAAVMILQVVIGRIK